MLVQKYPELEGIEEERGRGSAWSDGSESCACQANTCQLPVLPLIAQGQEKLCSSNASWCHGEQGCGEQSGADFVFFWVFETGSELLILLPRSLGLFEFRKLSEEGKGSSGVHRHRGTSPLGNTPSQLT